jgi:hypothetical protein
MPSLVSIVDADGTRSPGFGVVGRF